MIASIEVAKASLVGPQVIRHCIPTLTVEILSGNEERTSLMPHPQSETANRRQSLCRVRTAVPVGSGDFPGHASGRNTTCSASRSWRIHEWSFPRGLAEKFVIFTNAPSLLRMTTLPGTIRKSWARWVRNAVRWNAFWRTAREVGLSVGCPRVLQRGLELAGRLFQKAYCGAPCKGLIP
jgi:hypothetical protein